MYKTYNCMGRGVSIEKKGFCTHFHSKYSIWKNVDVYICWGEGPYEAWENPEYNLVNCYKNDNTATLALLKQVYLT